MRDPDGALELGDTWVNRHLREDLPEGHFLRSALAQALRERGALVPFRICDSRTIESDRVPFVTQPFEWCDAQLFDAASLTLDLQQEAVEASFELKDASAWNVLFDGTRPVFCDLMSFVPLETARWWAAGQFARHFILPLAVARLKGLHARTAFQLSRDGLLPDDARRILGPARFLSRYWPAMAGGAQASGVADVQVSPPDVDARLKQRRGLHATFRWMIDGARPLDSVGRSLWSRYRDERSHYPEAGLALKRETLGRWLQRLSPQWVLDLGCNSGEFSRLAADAGASVVAVDGDHDAIQALYREGGARMRIHPLIASLDDLSGGRGWEGVEHPGLLSRLEGRFDVVLALALIHHLTVANAVPLAQVAGFLRRCSRRSVVVEWIDEFDTQMLLLCRQRRRDPAEFSVARQREAFLSKGFRLVDEQSLPGGRVLALLDVEAA